MDYVETVNVEDLARVDRAIDTLARRDGLWLWLGEPGRDGNGEVGRTRVDWFRIGRFFDADVLAPTNSRGIFEEAVCIIAARRGLVSMKQELPLDGSTTDWRGLTSPVHDRSSLSLRVLCRTAPHPLHPVPWPEDWVQEDAMLAEINRDEHLAPRSLSLTTFVARDALEPDHLPHIEHFLFRAEMGPFNNRRIEATDEVMFASSVLEDVEQI